MTTAHLNFETTENGQVHVMQVYEGGFRLDNPAHCFARALMQKAGELGAEQVGEPVVNRPSPDERERRPILAPGCGPAHEPS